MAAAENTEQVENIEQTVRKNKIPFIVNHTLNERDYIDRFGPKRIKNYSKSKVSIENHPLYFYRFYEYLTSGYDNNIEYLTKDEAIKNIEKNVNYIYKHHTYLQSGGVPDTNNPSSFFNTMNERYNNSKNFLETQQLLPNRKKVLLISGHNKQFSYFFEPIIKENVTINIPPGDNKIIDTLKYSEYKEIDIDDTPFLNFKIKFINVFGNWRTNFMKYIDNVKGFPNNLHFMLKHIYMHLDDKIKFEEEKSVTGQEITPFLDLLLYRLFNNHRQTERAGGGPFSFLKKAEDTTYYSNMKMANLCLLEVYKEIDKYNDIKIRVKCLFKGFVDKSNENYVGYNSQFEVTDEGHEYFSSLIKNDESIIYIRHGQGYHNKPINKKIHDSPLTPLGIFESILVGYFLKKCLNFNELYDIVGIISSELIRPHITVLSILEILLNSKGPLHINKDNDEDLTSILEVFYDDYNINNVKHSIDNKKNDYKYSVKNKKLDIIYRYNRRLYGLTLSNKLNRVMYSDKFADSLPPKTSNFKGELYKHGSNIQQAEKNIYSKINNNIIDCDRLPRNINIIINNFFNNFKKNHIMNMYICVGNGVQKHPPESRTITDIEYFIKRFHRNRKKPKEANIFCCYNNDKKMNEIKANKQYLHNNKHLNILFILFKDKHNYNEFLQTHFEGRINNIYMDENCYRPLYKACDHPHYGLKTLYTILKENGVFEYYYNIKYKIEFLETFNREIENENESLSSVNYEEYFTVNLSISLTDNRYIGKTIKDGGNSIHLQEYVLKDTDTPEIKKIKTKYLELLQEFSNNRYFANTKIIR